MPKRVYSDSDRDDDVESNSNQSAPKRTRKLAEDREIVRNSLIKNLYFQLFLLRMIFVKNCTMHYALLNPKMVELLVKISFVYQAKGIFLSKS